MNNDKRWVLGRQVTYLVLGYLLAANTAVVYVAVTGGSDTTTLQTILNNNTTLLSIVVGAVFGGKAIKETLLRRK